MSRKEIESLRQRAKQDFNQTDGSAVVGSQIESEDGFRREAMKVGVERQGDLRYNTSLRGYFLSHQTYVCRKWGAHSQAMRNFEEKSHWRGKSFGGTTSKCR